MPRRDLKLPTKFSTIGPFLFPLFASCFERLRKLASYFGAFLVSSRTGARVPE